MTKTDPQQVLAHFKKVDPKIHAVMLQMDFNDWFADQAEKHEVADLFKALCREIVGQQLSGKAANAIFAKFMNAFPQGLTPEAIAQANPDDLRQTGLSWAKVRYVQNLAKHVVSGQLDPLGLPQLSDEEVITTLTQVKGIGPWTAEMFLIFTLGREDVFSLGDLGLKKGISKVYGIVKPTEKQMHKITKPWHPYRSFGSVALWGSLELP